VSVCCWQSAQAALTIEITKGKEGAQPIAIVPFGWQGDAGLVADDVSVIVAQDLERSGSFAPLPEKDLLARPHEGTQVNFRDWRLLGAPNLVIGKMSRVRGDRVRVQFQLFDVYRESQTAGFSFEVGEKNLRRLGHQISDIIYETLTGQKGAFSTRIAYVTAENKRPRYYALYVADVDGYSPQLLMRSQQPLMSPAWSPDGRKLAYVSFEAGRPMIYVQEVATGDRERIAAFPGINGAPTWSPDGTQLAMTLSKDGNPEIYVMTLETKELQRVTDHYQADTEPAWLPDGKSLVFTSDRGGSPQIYQVDVSGGTPKRLTWQGKYNARASVTADGKRLVLISGDGKAFRVAMLDMETKVMQVLTDGQLDESPSLAPNGRMAIYATKYRGRGVLAAVSVDGRVSQRIALEEGGDAREPAWGPVLTGK
jgi:TolB protein